MSMSTKIDLPGLDNAIYWGWVKSWAKTHSDGCTGVPDRFVAACHEHDYHYKYAVTLFGDPITFDEANTRFRKAIQMRSRMGRFSPLAWIRFEGVNAFGRRIWDRHRAANATPPEHDHA